PGNLDPPFPTQCVDHDAEGRITPHHSEIGGRRRLRQQGHTHLRSLPGLHHTSNPPGKLPLPHRIRHQPSSDTNELDPATEGVSHSHPARVDATGPASRQTKQLLHRPPQ